MTWPVHVEENHTKTGHPRRCLQPTPRLFNASWLLAALRQSGAGYLFCIWSYSDMNLSETHVYRGSVCRKFDLLLLPLVVLVVLLAVVLVDVAVAVIMIVMTIYNSNDEYERYHYNCCCCHYYCSPYCTATATDDVLRENIISQNIPKATISQEYIKWKPQYCWWKNCCTTWDVQNPVE